MRVFAIAGQVQRDHVVVLSKGRALIRPLATAAHETVYENQRCHLRPPCTIRSRIMAQNRIENPARIPCPTLAYCSASSTSSPSPLAPIREATTTIASDSMIVLLMPARIDGLASGRSTLVSS